MRDTQTGADDGGRADTDVLTAPGSLGTSVASTARMGFVRVGAGVCAVVLAGFLTAACGGTTPVSPTTTPSPQFPALVGDWEANNPVTLVFRDSNAESLWVCHVVLTVKSQTGGTFTGFVDVQGGNDKYCTYG